MAERGRVHEAAYRDFLIAAGRDVVDAGANRRRRHGGLIAAGADVIAQARLTEVGVAGRWHRSRISWCASTRRASLRRRGRAIYGIHEAKLATETRAGAVLQLCVYANILGRAIRERRHRGCGSWRRRRRAMRRRGRRAASSRSTV